MICSGSCFEVNMMEARKKEDWLFFERDFAKVDKYVGVHMFAGKLPNSFAIFTPSAIHFPIL